MSFFFKVFRLVFALSFLFIIGDALYRLEGFLYYSTFSEFLPSFALTLVVWGIITLIASILLCLPINVFRWFCRFQDWKINTDNFLTFLFCFVLIGTLTFISIKIFRNIVFLPHNKLFLLSFVIIATSVSTWFLRGKLNLILEKITPLVWLFSIMLIVSVPMLIYHAWIKDTDTVSKISQHVSLSDKKQPNILLVTFDALSAPHMSLYGYHRNTTPFINKWAESASLFTNLKASDGITTPTTASLMTGQRVWTHLSYHQLSHIPRGRTENIALMLKNNGYYTISYTENHRGSPLNQGIIKDYYKYVPMTPRGQDFLEEIYIFFVHSFEGRIKLFDWIFLDDFYPTSLFKKYVYYPILNKRSAALKSKQNVPKNDFTILDKFIQDFDSERPPEPFFAWLHFMPPHQPYLPPEPFIGTYNASSTGRTLHDQNMQRLEITSLIGSGQFDERYYKLLDTYRDRYDEHVLFSDSKFKEFINRLKKRNAIHNTVIIFSADHGESFENQMISHGPNLYSGVMQIPLIIKYPHQSKGQTIHALVEQIDIPATILDIAKIPLPSWMEGRSLIPLMQNKRLPPKAAFSMNLELNKRHDYIKRGIFAVWEGDYKLIHFRDENRSLLFNLKEDPQEQNNLFDKEPDKGQYLLGLIQSNLKKANMRIQRMKEN